VTATVSTTHPNATPRQRRAATHTAREHRRPSHPRPDTAPIPAPVSARPIPALDAGPITSEQSAELWAMTKTERIEAMNAGRLSLAQLAEWSGARPDQVPRIGNEFAWLVIHDPVWCEPTRPAAEFCS
jgi:hypothetical protein